MLREMQSQPWTVVVAEDGAFDMIKAEPKIAGTSELAVAAGVGHVRKFLATLGSWVPKDPVRVGSTWTRREELPIGLATLIRANELSVRSFGETDCIVDSRMTITSARTDQGPASVSATVHTKKPGQATIVFDVDRGMVTRIDTRIGFDMSIEGVSAEGRPIVSAQSLRAATRLELIAIDEPVLGN